MSTRSSFALPLLAVVALVGCTPDALESDTRDVLWDVPGLTTSFDGDGVVVQPEAGPTWRWELLGIHPEGRDDLLLGDVDVPVSGDDTQSFGRGAVVEHYVRRAGSIEQQFLIEAPLDLRGNDLVIEGDIETDGDFSADSEGWIWANDAGAVRLGDVTVFDADGLRLPAHMEVTAESTRIVVDAEALETAAYPVLIDPVIGPDDFQVSDAPVRANDAAVAHDPGTDTFLVVWDGRPDAASEKGIWSRRVDSAGSPLGTDLRISDDVDATLDGQESAVAFDPATNTYLVVWSQERVDGEFEIYGQRVNADGTLAGANFRVSAMGVEGDTVTDAVQPRVAWNAVDSTFYVVFEADVVNGDQQIYGVPVSAAGVVGTVATISTGIASGHAVDPDLAVGADGTIVVVWRADGVLNREVFGATVDNTGAVSAPVQLTLQAGAGSGGSPTSERPRIVYNPVADQFAVVVQGRSSTTAATETEIFGQLLSNAMVPVGTTVQMGTYGSGSADNATEPVIGVTSAGTYVVAFEGGPLGSSETYAFEATALLVPDGAAVAISSMGGAIVGFDGFDPALAFSTTANAFLVVFEGDDLIPGDDEDEIFAQLFAPANDTPVAAMFGAPYTADLGDAIAFADASTDSDGNIVSWAWDFGDGNTSVMQNPSHTYATAGTFTVSLTVLDDGGAPNTTTTTATVDGGPVAMPGLPAGGVEGAGLAFTGDFTDDGVGHAFLWDFGDGATSTLQNPTHAYADNGTFTVTFTVTDSSGRPGTASGTVTVGNVAPVANATIPTSGTEGSAVSFTSTPTDAGVADTFSYAWDFGDGTTSTLQNPTHVFVDDGSYTVSLVVTDDDSGSSMVEDDTVVVANVAPTANANGPYRGTIAPLAFSGTASDPGTDDVLSYAWAFGDGSTSNEQNPMHTYATAGTFTATLTVTDGDGGSDVVSASVSIGAPDTLQAAVDNIIVYANSSYTDLVGGPDVISTASGARLRPGAIRKLIEPILDNLANNGCRTSTDIQGYMAGAYATPVMTGFHNVGDGDILNGTINAGARVLGGDLDGIGLSYGDPGSFSTYNNQGQSYAVRSDGGFAAGRFVRVRGARGIWLAVHGTCDDTVATSADALDPWYVGNLP